MSEDRTREIVRLFERKDDRVRLLDNPARFKPHALNIGIKAAEGAWIMRLDAHSKFPEDYLVNCLETSQRTGAANVGGVFESLPRDSSLQASTVQALTTHKFGVGDADFRLQPKEGPAGTVPFGFFRRDLFDKVGLFDERLIHTQDQEFNARIRESGEMIWLNPRIRVQYFNLGKLFPFFKKAMLDRGQWNPFRWWIAPYSFRPRHAIPTVFVLGILLAVPALVVEPRAFYFVGVVGALYGVLAIGSSIQQAVRYRKSWLGLLLPPLFLTYHLSYGTGGLIGVVRLLAGTAPVQRAGKSTRSGQ